MSNHFAIHQFCIVGVLFVLQTEMTFGMDAKPPTMLTSQLQNTSDIINASIITKVSSLNQYFICITKLHKLKGYIFVMIGGIAGGMSFGISAVLLCEVQSLVRATYYLVMSLVCTAIL